jgi:ribose transport system ATP-binding protein
VLVLHEGRLAGELTRAGLTEEAVMHLATGGNSNSEAPNPKQIQIPKSE